MVLSILKLPMSPYVDARNETRWLATASIIFVVIVFGFVSMYYTHRLDKAEQEFLRNQTHIYDNLEEIPMDLLLKAKILVVEQHKLQDWDVDSNESLFKDLTVDDIYVVWFSKTLGNWKALLSSDAWDDTSYYEITHNGDKHETYVDHYRKVSNKAVQDDTVETLREKINTAARDI